MILTPYHKMREDASEMYKLNKKLLGIAMLNAGIKSAKELAALANISPNTVSRLNNGGSVKLATVIALAKALGVEPEEILQGV